MCNKSSYTTPWRILSDFPDFIARCDLVSIFSIELLIHPSFFFYPQCSFPDCVDTETELKHRSLITNTDNYKCFYRELREDDMTKVILEKSSFPAGTVVVPIAMIVIGILLIMLMKFCGTQIGIPENYTPHGGGVTEAPQQAVVMNNQPAAAAAAPTGRASAAVPLPGTPVVYPGPQPPAYPPTTPQPYQQPYPAYPTSQPTYPPQAGSYPPSYPPQPQYPQYPPPQGGYPLQPPPYTPSPGQPADPSAPLPEKM